MATRPTEVTLSLDDCEPNALPPVCCKCGAEATGEKEVEFNWVPQWTGWVMVLGIFVGVGLAIGGILALTYRKSRSASMPVCARHRGLWNPGNAVILGTIGAVGLVMLVKSVLVRGPDAFEVVWHFYLGLLVAVVVGVLVGVAVRRRGVVATSIEPDAMVLVNLHPDFVEAVENHSPERRAAYYAARNPASQER